MNFKGAIFDVDGTLLDSMFIWDSIGEIYLRSLGIEPHNYLNETLKNMSLYQAACYYRREYGVTLSTDEIQSDINGIIAHYYEDEVSVKPGVPQFLTALQENNVKLCIATATDRHLIEAALKRCGIFRFFSEIFTCTSVGHGKDEPIIFETALAFLSTEKGETMVFEDALYAAKTAKHAGFQVAGIYDVYEKQQTELQKTVDFYLNDFTEAEEILL